MIVYVGALAEIAACRLRILARSLGTPSAARNRLDAVNSLDLFARKIFDARFSIDGSAEVRAAIKRHVLYVGGDSVTEANILSLASSWDEWARQLDEMNRPGARRKTSDAT